jgi:hypothetical protein
MPIRNLPFFFPSLSFLWPLFVFLRNPPFWRFGKSEIDYVRPDCRAHARKNFEGFLSSPPYCWAISSITICLPAGGSLKRTLSEHILYTYFWSQTQLVIR